MQLFIIRHGQSENNLLWDQTGSPKGRSADPGLTPLGVRQAARVAKFLAVPVSGDNHVAPSMQNRFGFGLTHLYSSLMLRAVATGCAIARAVGLPLCGWEDWHEGGGIYLEDELSGEPLGMPGKDRAYFTTHFKELVLPDGRYNAGWWNREYETVEFRQARAKRAVGELLARHGERDDHVAVVSHGEFYNYILAELFQLPIPPKSRCWFSLNNVGVTRIDFQNGSVIPMYMNRVDFLPSELVT